MSYPFNYPAPQNANVQMFSNPGSVTDWVKPQGVSFVWFTLIGGGGGGGGTDGTSVGGGGGSGGIIHCLAPAFILPDILRVTVGAFGVGGVGAIGTSGGSSTVTYYVKSIFSILSATGGGAGQPNIAGSAGSANSPTVLNPAMISNPLSGQVGSVTNTTASTTVILSGGSAGTVTANYGYTTTKGGTFQISPILVGTGGGSDTSGAYKGGVGCGGGGISNLAQTTTTAGAGGAGMVVIISW